MSRSRILVLVALAVVVVQMLTMAGAGAVDTDTVISAPEGLRQTVRDNVEHHQAVLADASSENWSCRVEQPVFVSQPEVDSERVAARGEDYAEASAECVDISMSGHSGMTLVLFLEYYVPRIGWQPIRDANGNPYRTICSLSGSKGLVAVTPYTINVVYPFGHASQGKMHRVGAQLVSPNELPPLYTESLSVSVNHMELTCCR